jgi:hypothetical protein
VLNAGKSVVADSDAAEALEPTDRSLDDPSYSPEAAPVILSPTSNDWLDALSTQGVPSRLAVASAIREEDIRIAPWPATLPGYSGNFGDSRENLPMIAGVRRCRVDDERHADSVHDESVLRAHFPAVSGAWTSGFAAAEGTDHDAVDDRQIGFEDACLPEQSEEVHMEIVPHTGFVPSPQPSVSGAARATTFEWHIFPPAICNEHVPVDLDHGTVRNAWSTALSAYRFLRGKQALQFREERIRHPSTDHSGSLHGSRDHKGAVRESRDKRGFVRAYKLRRRPHARLPASVTPNSEPSYPQEKKNQVGPQHTPCKHRAPT